MSSYSRRNPVLFPQRSLWKHLWPLFVALALLATQRALNIPTANWIARLIGRIGTRHQVADGHAKEQLQSAECEIWALRRQITQLQAQVGALSLDRSEMSSGREIASQYERLSTLVSLRDPGDWAGFVWVELPNRQSPETWLESPAIVGDCAVGLVDFCRGERCRIRLLSDAQLSLSVTIPASQLEGDLACVPGECPPLVGQVRGFGGALCNSSGSLLAGEGYIPGPPKSEQWRQPLIEGKRQFAVGDLLVTSGLDGIFPSGLRVGSVESVETARPAQTRYLFSLKSAIDLHRVSQITLLRRKAP